LNLLQRIAVAVVGVPAICFLIRLGSWPLLLMVAAQALLCSREFFNLAGIKYHGAFARTGMVLAFLLPVAAFVGVELQYDWLFPLMLLVAPALASVVAMFSGAETDGFISRISVTGFGIIYFGGLMALQIPLRHGAGGADWLLLAYLMTWVVDVGGYVAGRLLGRHKLCPRLSPGKTWEGAVGGLLFALALSWGVGGRMMGLFGTETAVIFALAVAIIAPAGDLVESVFKRDVGVKDSSNILPGHGGLLDRFDSFLFVVPLTLIIKLLVG
jgi:phosphatidate cytidylyltransferase